MYTVRMWRAWGTRLGGWVTRIAWILHNASCPERGALVRWLLSGWVGIWFLLGLLGVLPRIMPSRILVPVMSHEP